jgi:HAD superfamily hydrolase (TIGR01509 family)
MLDASRSERMDVRAVFFDLFDTLVRFDRDRLPEVTIAGRIVRSTAGHLHPILRAWSPDLTLETFHKALQESWQEAERRRAIDHREVAAPERFAYLFRCLALDPDRCPPGLLQNLLDTHRRELSKAAEFPAHHGPLLTDLARRYRVALVSNFDYTPTALGILREAGVADLFDTIVVSDEIGWRKPAPAIFEEALRRVGVTADQTLFVGDRPDIDVLGAHQVGMRTAWINPDAAPLPPGIPKPDVELRDLGDLRPVLGI